MFSQIKTSKENKEVVVNLSRKLNLGAENVIARIAFTYSLSQDIQLNIEDLSNSGGKEYSRGVLFGDNFDVYIALLCKHYGLYKTDKDIPKYVKLHVDHGLELLNSEYQNNSKLDGFEFISQLIADSYKAWMRGLM